MNSLPQGFATILSTHECNEKAKGKKQIIDNRLNEMTWQIGNGNDLIPGNINFLFVEQKIKP